MTGTPARIGGRHVVAVLAMGGGLMLGRAATAHAAASDGLGLPARTSPTDGLAEPSATTVRTATEHTTLAPPRAAPGRAGGRRTPPPP
ncbi:hypothetical protein [Streptomyces thermolilacinus]|uniref:hypothetical protein n=1 Tax=Streptomyces thermolilacinus TaxID=285540 RepID=UPI0003C75FAD|nr:hypothetical protein [Streptomyces thermolilacinus]